MNLHRRISNFLLGIALLLTVSSLNFAQEFKFLEVKVLDEDGKPMPEVSVEIEMDGLEFPMPTDELGMVSLNISASNTPVELRVRHAGYESQRKRWRRGFEVPEEFSFRMTVGQPIEGLVLDSAGKPIVGAEVFTAPPEESLLFVNGENPPKSEQQATTTDADGKFTLPLQPIGTTIACLSDAGWSKLAMTSKREGKPLEIRLTPWAKVQLVTRVFEESPTDETVGLQFVSAQDKDRGQVTWEYEGKTNDRGEIRWDRVVPGTAMAYRVVTPRATKGLRTTKLESHGLISTLVSDQETKIVLGNASKHATGKLFKPVSYAGTILWESGYVQLTENNAFELAFRTAIFEYGKLLGQSNVYRPEQRVPPSGIPNYLVRYVATVDADGSFTIKNVPPGQYKLSAVLPAQPTDDPNRKDVLKLEELPVTLTDSDDSDRFDLGEHLLQN